MLSPLTILNTKGLFLIQVNTVIVFESSCFAYIGTIKSSI